MHRNCYFLAFVQMDSATTKIRPTFLHRTDISPIGGILSQFFYCTCSERRHSYFRASGTSGQNSNIIRFSDPVSCRREQYCGDQMMFTYFYALQQCKRVRQEKAVRLSVKRVICDINDFIPYKRTFILVCRHEEWLVGNDLLYKKFWSNRPGSRKNADF